MGALRKVAESRLVIDYDRDADVLYVNYGPSVPGYGDAGEDDMIFRYSEADDAPIGVTIIGFASVGWPSRRRRLYYIISKHLHLNETTVASAFSSAGV